MCPKWVPDTLATLYIQHTLEEAFFGILLATYLGCGTALFCTRTYNRILRPGLCRSFPSRFWTTPNCARASTRSIK